MILAEFGKSHITDWSRGLVEFHLQIIFFVSEYHLIIIEDIVLHGQIKPIKWVVVDLSKRIIVLWDHGLTSKSLRLLILLILKIWPYRHLVLIIGLLSKAIITWRLFKQIVTNWLRNILILEHLKLSLIRISL